MNSPALRKTWEGRVVDGKYPLRQWLGGSGHSEVFLTKTSGAPSQKAALKLLPAATVDVDEQLARWRVIAGFAHPNLMRVFDSGRCTLDGTAFLYLVTEYAEEDLSQILPQRSLTPAEAADFLPPTLDALSYIHKKGFIHGAVKPANIQAVNNQLKLPVDRLIASGGSADKSRTPTAYDAPEIGTASETPAADTWSLGITLVEALTQHVPVSDGNGEPVVPESLPLPFRGIARACLRRDAKQRSSIADIRTLLSGPATAISAPPSAQPRTEGKRSSNRILIPAAAILVVAGIFVGQRLLSHRGSTDAASTSGTTGQPAAPSVAPLAPRQSTPKPSQAPRGTAGGEVVHQVIPDVPKSASNTIQGKIKVVVRANVDSSGKVTGVALTTPGPSKYFANLALKAAQQWEFSPPVSGGKRVPSIWNLRFQFSRASTQVFPTRAVGR
jgi:TonB family protein